jgi:hypothetical protein
MPRGEQLAKTRTLALLVLLCFTVLGQWCALDLQHQQHGSDEHCCLLCHVGPHAALDGVAPVYSAPVFSAAWVAPAPVGAHPLQAPVRQASSRAPPAGSLS